MSIFQFELHTRSTKLGHPQLLAIRGCSRREARAFTRKFQKECDEGTITERWVGP